MEPEPMRCLSVRQPWTFSIARGFKPVENRNRPFPPSLTGVPVALHASLKRDDIMSLPTREATRALLAAYVDPEPAFVVGAIIAVVRFGASHRWPDPEASCYSACPCSAWSEMEQGAHHWPVTLIAALPEPVPCKGMLGLWRLPDDVEKAVRDQLEGSDG